MKAILSLSTVGNREKTNNDSREIKLFWIQIILQLALTFFHNIFFAYSIEASEFILDGDSVSDAQPPSKRINTEATASSTTSEILNGLQVS